MTKIAILLASSEYELYDPLDACKNDLEMMKNLLEDFKEKPYPYLIYHIQI